MLQGGFIRVSPDLTVFTIVVAKFRVKPISMAIMADNSSKEAKAKRLAEQLRANLQRRKQQARSRRAGHSDSRDEGIKAAPDKAAPLTDQN